MWYALICAYEHANSQRLLIGIKMEGLFRVPGPAAVLEEFRSAFEEGMNYWRLIIVNVPCSHRP